MTEPVRRARTVAFLVLGSTRASTATMRAGIGVVVPGVHPDAVPHLEPRGDALRHREVHVDGLGHALEGGELGALVQVLTDVDVGDAHPGPERRADTFLAMSARVRAISAWATSYWARA